MKIPACQATGVVANKHDTRVYCQATQVDHWARCIPLKAVQVSPKRLSVSSGVSRFSDDES